MSDKIECPYCEEDFEVCTDDGQHYNDGESQQDECPNCGKGIMIYSSCSWYREANKADCLNGSPHKWSEWYRLYDGDENGVNAGKELRNRYCEDCEKEEKEWHTKEQL